MQKQLIISVDAMGGDNAPQAIIDGIDYYVKKTGASQVRFLLHGDESVLAPLLGAAKHASGKCEIRHTASAIGMDTKPSHALRRGKGTSVWNAIEAVKEGEAHAGISAGNTGALMAISRQQLRMKGGMQRPALSAVWPQVNGMTVILDVGANVNCSSAQLTEFAVLGDAYYRYLFKKDNPRIGILNNGTEELKGNEIVRGAHERLNESALGLNYIGFIEGNDISSGVVDVVVTDGFTGNIALKTAEGTAKLISTFFRETLRSTLWSKFTSLLNYVGFKNLIKRMDPRKLNGSVFLGLNGIVVKSHGGTDGMGFANALDMAVNLARSGLLKEIETTLTDLHNEDEDIGFIA